MQGFRKVSGVLGLCSSGLPAEGVVGGVGSQSPRPVPVGLLCAVLSSWASLPGKLRGPFTQIRVSWGSLEGGATCLENLALPFLHSPSDLASPWGEVQRLLRAAQLGCAWA